MTTLDQCVGIPQFDALATDPLPEGRHKLLVLPRLSTEEALFTRFPAESACMMTFPLDQWHHCPPKVGGGQRDRQKGGTIQSEVVDICIDKLLDRVTKDRYKNLQWDIQKCESIIINFFFDPCSLMRTLSRIIHFFKFFWKMEQPTDELLLGHFSSLPNEILHAIVGYLDEVSHAMLYISSKWMLMTIKRPMLYGKALRWHWCEFCKLMQSSCKFSLFRRQWLCADYYRNVYNICALCRTHFLRDDKHPIKILVREMYRNQDSEFLYEVYRYINSRCQSCLLKDHPSPRKCIEVYVNEHILLNPLSETL